MSRKYGKPPLNLAEYINTMRDRANAVELLVGIVYHANKEAERMGYRLRIGRDGKVFASNWGDPADPIIITSDDAVQRFSETLLQPGRRKIQTGD